MARMLGVGTLCGVALGILVAGPVLANGNATSEPTVKEKRIQKNLHNDRDLANNRVDVRVSPDGVATLTGVVDSDSERTRAVQLASVPGVRMVADQLKVGTAVQPAPSDGEITAAIEGAMFSQADLRNGNVSVTTKNGVATLSGTVSSPEVRNAAVELASQTDGVVRVEDRLQLIGNTPSDPEVPMR